MGDRQVFIGNLCDLSNETIRRYCEGYGPLAELVFNRDKENNVYHCFAFVTFQETNHITQFMLNRPHSIHGKEVFVKRALPRSISSIPERLIVTNRLILQNFKGINRRMIRHYFQKFGRMKTLDFDIGFIDYEDYDDVDRVLLTRPHYIDDKEINVTKFTPSEQSHSSDDQHRYRSNSSHRSIENNQNTDRNITTSSSTTTFRNSPSNNTRDDRHDTDKDQSLGWNYLNSRYDDLKEKFYQYKKSKDVELANLRMDLERAKQQLADSTHEKLDRLLQNQQLFHRELLNRLASYNRKSIHTEDEQEYCQSTTKKRKLSTTSNNHEYDFYS